MKHRLSSARPSTRVAMVVLATASALALAGCRERPVGTPPARAIRVAAVTGAAGSTAVRYTGALEPRWQIDVAFKTPGKVAALGERQGDGGLRPLEPGDPVERGELLAWLDDSDLRTQAEAAEASAASARAQTDAARSALAQAEAEVARARRLHADRAIAKAELDRAETAFATAKANVAAAEAQHRGRAEQRTLARSTLDDAKLLSPLDGIVARRTVDVGESVMPGAPVFTIIDATEMRLVVGVPDVRINTIEIGMPVAVQVAALPGQSRDGTIVKIAPTADPALRSYAVEVALPNSDGVLRGGMVASATIELGAAAATNRIPLSAVVRDPQPPGFAVFVLVPDRGVVERRPVELGDLYDNDVLVRTGLIGNEQVVSEGAQLLRDGDAVQVVP